jgi:hypothetical protein
VLYLGRLVSSGPASDYNTASTVDLMTTGATERSRGSDAAADTDSRLEG